MLLDTLEFSVNLIIDAHNFCICCCLIMDLYMMQWWKFTVIFTLLKSIIFFYKLMQNLPFVNIDLLILKTVMSIF